MDHDDGVGGCDYYDCVTAVDVPAVYLGYDAVGVVVAAAAVADDDDDIDDFH